MKLSEVEKEGLLALARYHIHKALNASAAPPAIEITPAMQHVIDAAVERAYTGKRKIEWMRVFAGGDAPPVYGESEYLPAETLAALREFVVSIKGPLATPVGGGFASLNVTIRQQLDLYACVRPIRYFEGIATNSLISENVDTVVFRENTEDIYAGIEWAAGTAEVAKVIDFLEQEMGVDAIRFPATSSIGIKPVSREGSRRLIRKAIDYTIESDRDSIALVVDRCGNSNAQAIDRVYQTADGFNPFN